MGSLTFFFIQVIRPKIIGLLVRLLYSGSRVVIGKNFRADSVPRIIIDKGSRLSIGDNVEFRRNVELRAHGDSAVRIGSDVRLDRGVRILSANNADIEIGSGTRIGLYSVLNGGGPIIVGEKCLISGFVYLQSSMHGFSNGQIDIKSQGYTYGEVSLGTDVWLGTHVVVFPNVKLGDHSIVGSNAVVSKSFEDGSVLGGVPAKLLKNRAQ